MKKYSTVLIVVYGLVTLFFNSSCALTTMGRNLVSDNVVKIERVTSKRARVATINVRQIDSKLSIFGTIKNKTSAGRGFIPGHIDIEFVDSNGDITNRTNIPYRRKNTKSRTSYFNLKLDVVLTENTTIRVIHHAGIFAKIDRCENHPDLNCNVEVNKKTL